MNITITLEEIYAEVDLGEGDYEELSLQLEISADMTYEPAKLDGPPEDCYPENSECDITELKILSAFDCEGNEIKLTKDNLKAIGDAISPRDFEEDLWDEFERQQEPDCED